MKKILPTFQKIFSKIHYRFTNPIRFKFARKTHTDSPRQEHSTQPPTLPNHPPIKSIEIKEPFFIKNDQSQILWKQSFLKSFERLNIEEKMEKMSDVFATYQRSKVHQFFLAALVLSFAWISSLNFIFFIQNSLQANKPNTKNRKVISSKNKMSPLVDDTSLLTSEQKKDLERYKKNNALVLSQMQKLNPLHLKERHVLDIPKVEEVEEQVIDLNHTCMHAHEESRSGLVLQQLILLQNRQKSVAMTQYQGMPKFLRVGDSIPGVLSIDNMIPKTLIVKNLSNGRCEKISLNDPIEQSLRRYPEIKRLTTEEGNHKMANSQKTAIKNDGNSFIINQSIKAEMLSNLNSILTQARAIQMNQPDGSLAFKIVEIEPGSIFSQLNIQEGDIIERINGKKIESLNEIMNLFGRIKDIQDLELSLKRGGGKVDQDYRFE